VSSSSTPFSRLTSDASIPTHLKFPIVVSGVANSILMANLFNLHARISFFKTAIISDSLRGNFKLLPLALIITENSN
jgi:hypothetical protein